MLRDCSISWVSSLVILHFFCVFLASGQSIPSELFFLTTAGTRCYVSLVKCLSILPFSVVYLSWSFGNHYADFEESDSGCEVCCIFSVPLMSRLNINEPSMYFHIFHVFLASGGPPSEDTLIFATTGVNPFILAYQMWHANIADPDEMALLRKQCRSRWDAFLTFWICTVCHTNIYLIWLFSACNNGCVQNQRWKGLLWKLRAEG